MKKILPPFTIFGQFGENIIKKTFENKEQNDHKLNYHSFVIFRLELACTYVKINAFVFLRLCGVLLSAKLFFVYHLSRPSFRCLLYVMCTMMYLFILLIMHTYLYLSKNLIFEISKLIIHVTFLRLLSFNFVFHNMIYYE